MKILLGILLAGILGGEYDAKVPNFDSILAVQGSDFKRGEWGCEVSGRKVSPNGQYEAYISGNNLYVYKKLFGTDLAITRDEDSLMLNGTSDWLYNEEFGCGSLFEWAPDSKMLAFIRLNEQDVASFEWQNMVEVEGENGRYPQTKAIRYPRVGTTNARAQVCVYDMQYKDIRTLDVGEYEYIPRIRFAGDKLFVQTLNRDQNKMQVMEVNPKSGVSKVWYREQCEEGWVDYKNFDEWQWLSDGNVIVVSARSGQRQVYLYAANGKKINQLTKNGVDVTKCYGYDEQNKILYYQVANTPQTRQCYANNEALTRGDGWAEVHFNADYTNYILDYQNETTPNQYTFYTKKGKRWKEVNNDILTSINAQNETIRAQWTGGEKHFFCFVTERLDTLYGWYLLPSKVESEKYPVVVMQYSGPESQRVVQKWRKRFEYALAEEGYIVVCVDVRGTGGRGQKWLHETYMNLGKKEAEDLISAAQWLQSEEAKGLIGQAVDPERMAIGGWSYGGFQTIRTMSEKDSPFQCGFAIAPVTDWRFYDSAYTERYMRRVQVNEQGYLNASLPKMAEQLKGRLLLVHGLADENVQGQNTWVYVDALVQAGKQFDMQVYPDDNHYLKKRGNYIHLHNKIIEFLNKNL